MPSGHAENGRTFRRPPGRLTVKAVEAALRQAAGVQSRAAEALGIDRSTMSRFVKKHPKVAQLIDDVVAEQRDVAHANLVDFLSGKLGDANTRWASTKYYLDNKGQELGFGVRKLAFSDGDGNVMVPGVLITPVRVLDGDEWEARNQPTT